MLNSQVAYASELSAAVGICQFSCILGDVILLTGRKLRINLHNLPAARGFLFSWLARSGEDGKPGVLISLNAVLDYCVNPGM